MKFHLTAAATASVLCATLVQVNGEEIFQGSNLSPDVQLLLVVFIASLIFAIICVFCCYCMGNWCPWVGECFSCGIFRKKASESAELLTAGARSGADELEAQASSSVSEAAKGVADAAEGIVPPSDGDAEAPEPTEE